MHDVRALPAYYNELPNFKGKYEKTPDNIKHVAHEVAELFALFLTREAHEGSLYQDLRDKNVILLSGPGRCLSDGQIDLFVEKLSSKIEEYLYSDGRRYFKLSVDHVPNEGLWEIMEEVDPDRVARSPFSARSHVAIEFDATQISVEAYFKGRAI